MAALLADGWFYISSAGLLVSGVLFFFLLGQYRAASEAADQTDPETVVETHTSLVSPLLTKDEPAPAPKVASLATEKPVVSPEPEAAPAAAQTRRETATGGVNPAVVYLQNIKVQLEQLHDETRDLAKRLDAVTSRDEALIERLSELAEAVAQLKNASPASVEAPAPKRARKAEPSPVPDAVPPTSLAVEPPAAVIVLESKIEAKPAPAAQKEISADETIRMELNAAIESQLSATQPKAAAEEPSRAEASAPVLESPAPSAEPEPEKPRRGPVWPV